MLQGRVLVRVASTHQYNSLGLTKQWGWAPSRPALAANATYDMTSTCFWRLPR